MVSVPVTSGRSARPVEPMGGARFQTNVARNFVGPAVEQFGAALRQGADDLDQVAAIHDEADALRIDNEFRAIQRETLRTGENAYLRTQGFNASEGREAVVDGLRTSAEGLLEGARSDRARKMAQRALASRLGDAETTIADHAMREIGAAKKAQLDAQLVGAVTDAVDARGTPDFAVNLGLAEGVLAQQADAEGWSDEQFDEARAGLVSDTWGKVILAMDAEDGEPTRAMEMLDEQKENILPDLERQLRAGLKSRVLSAKADDIVYSGALDQYLPEAVVSEGEGGATVVNDGSAIASELFPGATITSGYRGPDHPLSKANPNSYHAKTHGAVDMLAVDGMTFEQAKQRFIDNGYTVVEAIDEYANPSDHATGGHWHFVLAEGGGTGLGSPGVAADPRLNSAYMREAVTAYAAANGLKEEETQALYDAASRAVAQGRGDRAQAEADADRRLTEYLTTHFADPDSLTSIGQIPASQLAGVSPATMAQLNARTQAASDRIAAAHDAEAAARVKAGQQLAAFELYAMTNEELATTDITPQLQRLGIEKAGPWIDKQQKLQEQGADSIVSNDRIAAAIDTYGKPYGASRVMAGDNAATEEERATWMKLREYVERRVGGMPKDKVTNEVLRATIAEAMVEVTVSSAPNIFGWTWDSTETRLNLEQGQRYTVNVPQDIQADIRAKFSARGITNVTNRMIIDAYTQGRAQGIYE